eukprot:3934363-Rhodomonas_salina.1
MPKGWLKPNWPGGCWGLPGKLPPLNPRGPLKPPLKPQAGNGAMGCGIVGMPEPCAALPTAPAAARAGATPCPDMVESAVTKEEVMPTMPRAAPPSPAASLSLFPGPLASSYIPL